MAASTVYFTTSVLNPNATNNGSYVSTLKQIAFWEFDDDGAVIKYDAWIPSLRLYSSIQPGQSNMGQGTVDPAPVSAQNASIQTLCGTTQQLCTSDNTQYTGVDDCVQTLSAKPYGDVDNIWADSVICRTVHVLLARIRPEVRGSVADPCVHQVADFSTRSTALISVLLVEVNASTFRTIRDTSMTQSSSESRRARISCARDLPACPMTVRDFNRSFSNDGRRILHANVSKSSDVRMPDQPKM